MKSTVLNAHWYLMGGYVNKERRSIMPHWTHFSVASCQPSEKPLPSVWKRFPIVPHNSSSAAVFGNRLIAIGGGYIPTSSIHACSPHTQSWVHVGDMPIGLCSTLYCSPPHRRVDGDRGG